MTQSIPTAEAAQNVAHRQSDDAAYLIELMHAIARQDKIGFREFYYTTSARLFGVIYAIVRDRAMAEDVMQELYIKIWQRAGDYREELGSPMAWVTVIARHRALDEIRKHTKLLQSGDMAYFEDIPADLDEPLTEMLEHEHGELLAHCLGRLERSKREMIVLAYKFGISREKLSEQYSTPVATVKTWLRRGLSELRNCMGFNV